MSLQIVTESKAEQGLWISLKEQMKLTMKCVVKFLFVEKGL